MSTIRVRNDDGESWCPPMPGQDDEVTPKQPPSNEIVLRDLEPIDERGHEGDAMRSRFGSTQNGNPGPKHPMPSGGTGGGKKGC